MFASGSRPAAKPRQTMDSTLATSATTVTTTAARPNRTPHGALSGGGTTPMPDGG